MIGICHRAAHVSYLLSDLAAVPVRACEQVSELELQGWGWLAQRLSRVFGAVQSLDRNSADKGSLRRYNSGLWLNWRVSAPPMHPLLLSAPPLTYSVSAGRVSSVY